MTQHDAPTLRRDIGLIGAVFLGLGAMLGTGVFVSIGIAAGVGGSAVLPAIALAALVALCNALSAAQLAAAHPVAGGTYEYGHVFLRPWLGFIAGWLFLCAKSASAATAALGLAGYFVHAVGWSLGAQVPLALGAALAMTALVVSGLRRSNRINIVIVSLTLLVLVVFTVLAGAHGQPDDARNSLSLHDVFASVSPASFFEATALMFVAFTGYGRIATLGEEVREPRQVIPRAIAWTVVIAAAGYIAVAAAAIGAVGPVALARATADDFGPLQYAARHIGVPGLAVLVSLGAITAMFGVLLNLILGLSRVVLAMGRRGDLPAVAACVDSARATPVVAVIGVGLLVALLTLIGDVATTWSFSAFTVLIYYALTNAAALRVAPADRRYPRAVCWAGLIGCLGLAFWIETRVWATGLVLIAFGLIWRVAVHCLSARA